ncbi:DUF3883 domain-containing protein [Schaalia sp. ZJ405]|uniref:helicase-related protein n=1 Tax=Schaalia sp. ZJ405 TaxID=2709403 RepID=UPI0013EB74CB|nr:helicase-related protein [Schaalia sp. ZJ405]QPK81223.1 DUF3883 domain-containing protein [Schaalia sp. ZJ405]
MPKPLTQHPHLVLGARIQGILPNEIAEILAVNSLAEDVVEVTLKDSTGTPTTRIFNRDDIDNFSLAPPTIDHPEFDADADDFRLAAEALRIKYAALYDPMIAINSSHIDPLPHQIRAVYEELLPRVPLRFLLADDPGAGKTVMAGLYIKELILRGDCERVIIVAPGGLVEQWREELLEKFDLRFEVFGREMLSDSLDMNPFEQHPRLIIRMDQVARNFDLMELLGAVEWDVAVIDEAHRMTAHHSTLFSGIQETKRFTLGRLLSESARNFLLMTATPHSGKEEDFQVFMSLLDHDRFEGQYRELDHSRNTNGLIRRMVKEDLLTFEGKPLFPMRKAYTMHFTLSDNERDLYEQVTNYVRKEMGRADRISRNGDKKRGNTVGFALTVLQRRLASSPEAILRSLERRRDRLSRRLSEFHTIASDMVTLSGDPFSKPHRFSSGDEDEPGNWDHLFDLVDFDELTDEERSSHEERIEDVVDSATAAQTIPELQAEISILDDLIDNARRVRSSGEDTKWVQLREIFDQRILSQRDGEPRKIIVFTEHRDTLEYLREKISTWLGHPEAVLTIHGGTSRTERKAVREAFTHDPRTVVLLATDAAGEGLNLQRAHLMVNYDLPWNPNRIEQRFGRIHRIGQREVCHLWNLLADDTRESDVFGRLLTKIDTQEKAFRGKLFNVLGEQGAFRDHSLRDLLVEAIRFGDDPQVRDRLFEVIDSSVSEGLDELVSQRALHPELFSSLNLEQVRARMERARERRLQPGYIEAFFRQAFARLGGQIRSRESGRFELTRVPRRLIQAGFRLNRLSPIPERYERVTFVPHRVRVDGLPDASLIAPGHPLLSALIDVTIEDLGKTLRRGTVLVDRRPAPIDSPALLFALEQSIMTSQGLTASRHFDFAFLSHSGNISVSHVPPYLEFDRIDEDEAHLLPRVVDSEWLSKDHEKDLRGWAYSVGALPRKRELEETRSAELDRTKAEVRRRLEAEINFWSLESLRLTDAVHQGKVDPHEVKRANDRAKCLEKRLEHRMLQLDADRTLSILPAVIRGVALVIPASMLTNSANGSPNHSPLFGVSAEARRQVERRAVDAVLATERTLGRVPEEMPANNPGFDVRSVDSQGRVFFIEVKGRIEGAPTFTVTANEVLFAQTQGIRHRLALVEVSRSGSDSDRVHYVADAFARVDVSQSTRSFNELWDDYWNRGADPREHSSIQKMRDRFMREEMRRIDR